MLKWKTILILTYLHRSRRHLSSQSQKCHSSILSDKSKFPLRISSTTVIFVYHDSTLMKSFPTYTASEQKTIWIDWFSARSRYILTKLFSREPYGKPCVGPKISFMEEMLEETCFYPTRSWNHVFVIVKTYAFGIDGGRLILGLFYVLNM